MTGTPKRRISLLNVIIDLLIYLVFMIAGFLVYYHFLVSPLFSFSDPAVSITISPMLTDLVGGFTNAVYLMAGLPFLIGLLGLAGLVLRLLRGLGAAASKV